jgi:hypothetical protein
MLELFTMCGKMEEGIQLLGGSPINAALIIILSVILGIGVLFLFNLVFKWIWNITLPEIFGIKEVTYWQSFRILVIVWLLFGSISGGHMIM